MLHGRLDKRLTFQAPGSGFDEFGLPVPDDFADVCTVWAAVRPVGSSERLAASQMQSGQTHVVTVRWSAQLAEATGAWRIQFGSRLFGIVGLPRCPNEARQWLIFDCTERVNG